MNKELCRLIGLTHGQDDSTVSWCVWDAIGHVASDGILSQPVGYSTWRTAFGSMVYNVVYRKVKDA